MTNSNRILYQADALDWLSAQGVMEGCSFITSLPDFSEFKTLTLEQWKVWFRRAATAVLASCSDDGIVLFYQTDIQREGVWIDKSFLCQSAAEATGHALLLHKIVCRAPAGTVTFARPAYSHLLGFSKRVRVPMAKSTANVWPSAGESTWTRGMGIDACRLACEIVRDLTCTRTVVDPFCGHGGVLAMANLLGLNSVGVDIREKCVRKARAARLEAAP